MQTSNVLSMTTQDLRLAVEVSPANGQKIEFPRDITISSFVALTEMAMLAQFPASDSPLVSKYSARWFKGLITRLISLTTAEGSCIKYMFDSNLDNKYPIVSLREPLPRRSTSETATFRWRSNEMAYYKCAVDDPKNFVDCGSGLTGDWTTSRLSNGKHTFYLLAKDEVGNTAPQLSHSWSIGE